MGKTRRKVPPPKTWTAPDGSTWSVTIKWAVLGGRAECVGVHIESTDWPPRPMGSQLWRSVPIASLIDRDAYWQANTGHAEMDRVEGPLFTRGRKVVGADGAVLAPAEALAEVASVYRNAWGRGLNPTQAVAEALSLSRSAAAKRVRRARDAGLLPETTRGRAAAPKEGS
jgi:hypothetical protein